MAKRNVRRIFKYSLKNNSFDERSAVNFHRTFLLDKKLKESLIAGQNHQTPNLDWIH